MSAHQEQLAALSDIRNMMEKSSRFISLSGLSGISAGITALIGAGLAYMRLNNVFHIKRGQVLEFGEQKIFLSYSGQIMVDLILIASAVLVIALAFGVFFTTRNARRKEQKIWDGVTKRLLANLAVPLMAGGIFCLVLIYHGIWGLVAPATLLFYGMALLNASKYTLKDVWYLGITQVVLGILASFFLGYGILFWAIGFGVLHIAYGTVMYVKYEAKETIG